MLSLMPQRLKTAYQFVYFYRQTELVQTGFELFNFALGLVGAHALVREALLTREVKRVGDNVPKWHRQAIKIINIGGNISLIIGALKSLPVLMLWRWSVKKILSPEQLIRFFGPNGMLPGTKVYASLGLIAFLIGLPSTIKMLYCGGRWIVNYYKHRFQRPLDETDLAVAAYTVSQTARQLMKNASFR